MAVAGRLAGWLSRYYFVRARNYHDKAEIGCAAARAVLSSETEIQLGARARARAFGSARALRSAASGRLIAGDGRCKFALSIGPFPCISHPFFYFFSLSLSLDLIPLSVSLALLNRGFERRIATLRPTYYRFVANNLRQENERSRSCYVRRRNFDTFEASVTHVSKDININK